MHLNPNHGNDEGACGTGCWNDFSKSIATTEMTSSDTGDHARGMYTNHECQSIEHRITLS